GAHARKARLEQLHRVPLGFAEGRPLRLGRQFAGLVISHGIRSAPAPGALLLLARRRRRRLGRAVPTTPAPAPSDRGGGSRLGFGRAFCRRTTAIAATPTATALPNRGGGPGR